LKALILIQKWVAVFLLLVFAVVTTPKRLLHHLLVNHSSATEQCDKQHSAVLQKQVPECPCDDLVAIPAFLTAYGPELTERQPVPVFSQAGCYRAYFPCGQWFQNSLRGPPFLTV